MSIAYSPDGHYIACGGIDGIVCIFDLATGEYYIVSTLFYHVPEGCPLSSVTFWTIGYTTGAIVAVVGENHTIAVF